MCIILFSSWMKLFTPYVSLMVSNVGFVKTHAHLLFFLGLWWFWIWFCWYACSSWCLKGISHTHTFYACPNVNKETNLCAWMEGLVFQNWRQRSGPWIWHVQFFSYALLAGHGWKHIHTCPTLVFPQILWCSHIYPQEAKFSSRPERKPQNFKNSSIFYILATTRYSPLSKYGELKKFLKIWRLWSTCSHTKILCILSQQGIAF